jgi:glutathione S-transferase
MITIHNFPRGARGIRVFWVCEEMGLAYNAVPVAFPPTPEYRALNPLGSAPFLENEGGVAINESVAMMLYLAERYGPTPLLPAKDDPAYAKVLQLTVLGEATLGAAMNPMMMARFMAPDADKDNW